MAIIVIVMANFLFDITGGRWGTYLFFFRVYKAKKLQEVISEQERSLSLYRV